MRKLDLVKKRKIFWGGLFLFVLVILILLLPQILLNPTEIDLPSTIQKYKEAEAQPTDLVSRKWLAFGMEVAKKQNYSPTAAARFYAYIASVFDDTLIKTQNTDQASLATREIFFQLVPESRDEIEIFSKQFKFADTKLNQEAADIIKQYNQRLKTDNYNLVRSEPLPAGDDVWYPRNGAFDKGNMAGQWQTWILNKQTDFQIPNPPKNNSVADFVEIEKIKYAVNQRAYASEEVISFWHGSSGFIKGASGDNITPSGVWQNVLFVETKDQNLDEKSYSAVQKKLAQSIADSFIITWREKYSYLTKRPSMKIADLALIVGDPPFPGYPSGHSTISYTAATVLSELVPAKKKIWFENAANAKNSRLLAGIHFDVDNQIGAKLGTEIGEVINGSEYADKVVVEDDSPNFLLQLLKLGIYKLANFETQSKKFFQTKIAEFRENVNSQICELELRNQIEGFRDITAQTNISFEKIKNLATQSGELTDERVMEVFAGGVVSADINNDQLVDLYFANPAGGKLFLNQGNLKFQDITQSSGISYQNGTGAVAADFDNDGFKDLLLYGHKVAPKLLHNNGNTTFTDVTSQVGLSEGAMISYGAAFGDYDNDGWLDLYLINYVDFVRARSEHISPLKTKLANLLFKNEGGKFKNVTKESGVGNLRASMAVSFLDFDQDGWSDILVANDFEKNTLLKNNRDGTFSDVSEILGYSSQNPNNAMGIALADLNRDGWIDFYTTNIYEDKKKDPGGNQLFLNNHGSSFVNQADKFGGVVGGWSWGVSANDYNNDGLADLAFVSGYPYRDLDNKSPLAIMTEEMVSPKLYFYQNSGKAFREKGCNLGLNSKNPGRGLVVADLDNDGFEDIVINESGASPRVYHNLGGDNKSLQVRLVGSVSNKDGVGAKVWVTSGGKRQYKELQTSGSYLSSGDLSLHFGLGEGKDASEIKVLWPSGRVSVLNDVAVGQTITIKEP